MKIEEYNKENMHTSKAREHCSILVSQLLTVLLYLVPGLKLLGRRDITET